jgi:hypothetical protein
MFIVFGLHLLFLSITPEITSGQVKTVLYLVCRACNLILFSSYIYALWEMTAAVFQVRDVMKKNPGNPGGNPGAGY